MKRQIRNSVFETNSSSTHSIAIPKQCESCSFVAARIGEFGWDFEEVDSQDYFYTAIYATSETENEAKEKIEKFKNILNKHNIPYKLERADCRTWNDNYFSLDNGYIDHSDELQDFVNELLENEDKLIRFLSGGLVFTGNDNSDTEERCFLKRNKEYLDERDWRTGTYSKIKNPYYMNNHEDYEWYDKGN